MHPNSGGISKRQGCELQALFLIGESWLSILAIQWSVMISPTINRASIHEIDQGQRINNGDFGGKCAVFGWWFG